MGEIIRFPHLGEIALYTGRQERVVRPHFQKASWQQILGPPKKEGHQSLILFKESFGSYLIGFPVLPPGGPFGRGTLLCRAAFECRVVTVVTDIHTSHFIFAIWGTPFRRFAPSI